MRRSYESSDLRKMNNLHQRVSLLRRSENGSVLGSGSILNDDTDADWNKRESQWWKRLDKEHTRTNFLPVSQSNFNNSEISVEESHTIRITLVDDAESENFSMNSVNSLPMMSPVGSVRQRGLFKKQLSKRNVEINRETANRVMSVLTSDAANANTAHIEQLPPNFLSENNEFYESDKNSNIDSLHLQSKIEIPLKTKRLFKKKKSMKKMAFSQAMDNSSKVMDDSKKNNDDHSSLNLKKSIVKPSKKLFKKSSKLKKSLFADAWSNLESDESKIEENKKSKVISVKNTNISEKEFGNTNNSVQQQNESKHQDLMKRRASRGSANNSRGRMSEQDVDSVKSGYPDFSPCSITSETINFDRWKRLASSTMLESDRSPKTSNKSKQALGTKLDLLPSAIMEEKEISSAGSLKALCQENKESIESSRDTAEMCLPVSSKDPSDPVQEFTKVNLLISPVKNKTNDSINENASKRTSKAHQMPKNSGLFKDNELPDAVRNMKKHSESHIQDIFSLSKMTESPQLEAPVLSSNLPNLQKRQSIGTWLRLQESDEELSPTLNQSDIDRQVIEELMAKRTNPPVRRSSHFENQHFDNTSENDSTDVEIQQKGKDITTVDGNDNGIVNEKTSVETENPHNLLTADKLKSTKKGSQESITNAINSNTRLIGSEIGESGNSMQVVTERYVHLQQSQQGIDENVIDIQLSQHDISEKEKSKGNYVNLQTSQQGINENVIDIQPSQQDISEKEKSKGNYVDLQTSQQGINENLIDIQLSQHDVSETEKSKGNYVNLQTIQQGINENVIDIQPSQQDISEKEKLKGNYVDLQTSQQGINENVIDIQLSQQDLLEKEKSKGNYVNLQTSQQGIKGNVIDIQLSQQDLSEKEKSKENDVNLQTSQQGIKGNVIDIQLSQQDLSEKEKSKENYVNLQTSQQGINGNVVDIQLSQQDILEKEELKGNYVNLQASQQNIVDKELKVNEVNFQMSQQNIIENDELKIKNVQGIVNIDSNQEAILGKTQEIVQIFSESSDVSRDGLQQHSRIHVESINTQNNLLTESTANHSMDPSLSIDQENLFIFVKNQRKGETINEMNSVNQETLYSSSDSLDDFQKPILGGKQSFATVDSTSIDLKSSRSPVKKSMSHPIYETSQDSEVHQVTPMRAMTPTTRFRLDSISLKEIYTDSNFSTNSYDNENMGTLSTPELPLVKTNKNQNNNLSIKRKITEEELDELAKKVMFENAKRMKRVDEMFTKRFDNEFKKPTPYLAQKIEKAVQHKQKPAGKAKMISKPCVANHTEVKVSKKPKLYMREQWITQKLYNFVENKLKLKYGLKSLARAEKFIKDLAGIVNTVVKSKTDYHHHVNTLKMEMARLHLVTTHFDFCRFIHEFLPFYFRIKSIPAEGRDVPKFTGRVFSPILKSKNK